MNLFTCALRLVQRKTYHLGRTLSVTQPDGARTTYSYSGNQSTVTDPAGNWKTFTSDVLGNLTTVVEPDPANRPSGTLATNYTYDWMNHVSQVSMSRAGTTQTRTFVYNNAGLLTSATNPENGTVTYTYNADNTLNTKQDAKGQVKLYAYNHQRLGEIWTYPNGQNNPEDVCQRVTYGWDGSWNPNYFWHGYDVGRLTGASYGPVDGAGNS
jgi:YD repeat-containing protein